MVGFRVWRAFPTVGTQAAAGGIVIRWRLFPRQGVRAWVRGWMGGWVDVVRGCGAWVRGCVGAGQRGRARARVQVQGGQTEGGGEGI
jgi:hypothetical protein